MKTTIAIAFITASLFIHAAQAQQAEQRPKRTVLQKSDVGATGREATMQIVEFAQGMAEVPHTHPGELIGYVLGASRKKGAKKRGARLVIENSSYMGFNRQ